MEKRLFLAVLLSLAVVFVFQALFGPKKTGMDNITQPIVIKEDTTKPASNIFPATSLPLVSNPIKENFAVEKKTINTPFFEVGFTNKGGNIDRLALKPYAYEMPVSQYLGLPDFNDELFSYTMVTKDLVEMTYSGQNWQITKTYSFNKPWIINVSISLKNITDTPQAVQNNFQPIYLDLSRLDNRELKSDWTLFEYSIKSDKKIIRKGSAQNFNDKWNKEESGSFTWIAFRDRYFATIVSSKNPFMKYTVNTLGEKKLLLAAQYPSKILNQGDTEVYDFVIVAGPQKLDVLKSAGKDFEKIMVFSNWGWLDAIAKGIYWLLGFLHKIIPSWGLCIILISLIVYGAMYPLTLKSMLSMKRMQALQPKMAELRERYKKNPEKLNKEIMELYKQHQVNPMSGCLPLLFQMPIFVGLYQVLWRSIYFRGEGFLWIKDLSMPDQLFKLPFTVPFLGDYFNILPILMTGIMFAQQRMTMKSMAGGDPEQIAQQKMMAVFFPIFLGFIFYNFASGLNLYFVVFYVLSTVSQWHIAKGVKAVV
jgi:YidC/Oxa1 family membrane protein insertase